MVFFNSLLIRVTLAIVGGAFYAFLPYLIVLFLNLSYELTMTAIFFLTIFKIC